MSELKHILDQAVSNALDGAVPRLTEISLSAIDRLMERAKLDLGSEEEPTRALSERVLLVGCGALAGATIALLLAPSSGAELRAKVSGDVERRTRRVREQLASARDDLISWVDHHAAVRRASRSEPVREHWSVPLHFVESDSAH